MRLDKFEATPSNARITTRNTSDIKTDCTHYSDDYSELVTQNGMGDGPVKDNMRITAELGESAGLIYVYIQY